MSKPTILSPWYVVTRFQSLGMLGQQEWYTSQESETENPWVEDRKLAMMFNSIHSAHRVAKAASGYVVVVADMDDYAEYRRG